MQKKKSFKHFLHYLHANGADSDYLNPHYSQQYIQGEEEFVTNYIYLENFSNEISKIENKYNLQTIPLDTLTRSWHHQAPKMIHKETTLKLTLQIHLSLGCRHIRAFMIRRL